MEFRKGTGPHEITRGLEYCKAASINKTLVRSEELILYMADTL